MAKTTGEAKRNQPLEPGSSYRERRLAEMRAQETAEPDDDTDGIIDRILGRVGFRTEEEFQRGQDSDYSDYAGQAAKAEKAFRDDGYSPLLGASVSIEKGIEKAKQAKPYSQGEPESLTSDPNTIYDDDGNPIGTRDSGNPFTDSATEKATKQISRVPARPKDPFAFVPQHLREELVPKADGLYMVEDYPARLRKYLESGDLTPEQAGKLHNVWMKWKDTAVGAELQAQRLQRGADQAKLAAMTGVMDQQTEGAQVIREAIDKGRVDQKEAMRLRNQYTQEWDRQIRQSVQEYDKAVERMKEMKFDAFGGSGLARVLGGLAVALGGAGAAIDGGPNRGLEIVNTVMRGALAEQQAEFGKLKNIADGKGNMIAYFRQHFGDMDRALEATQIHLLNQMKMHIQARQVDQSGAMAQRKKEVLVAGIDKKIHAHERRLYAQTRALADRRAAARLRASMRRRKPNIPGVRFVDDKTMEKLSQRYSSELKGYVTGSADAKRIDERMLKLKEAKASLNRLRAIYEGMSDTDKYNPMWDSAKFADATREYWNMVNAMRSGAGVAGEPGHEALDKGWERVGGKILIEPGGLNFFWGRFEPGINHIEQALNAGTNEARRAYADQLAPGEAPIPVWSDDDDVQWMVKFYPTSDVNQRWRSRRAQEAGGIVDNDIPFNPGGR